jgi:hemerythrin-like domain-containing protein
MTRGALLHPAPAAGFDQPFALLDACHERVQRSLALLLRLAEHLVQHGADAQAADAARDVMRYFDLAAPLHHEDEERHVLPRLRAAGHGALAQRLQDDHAALAALWQPVRAVLQSVADGLWDTADAVARTRDWPAWAQRYREHIALEDTQAFPACRALLDDAQARSMGEEMASRRGVHPPP